MSRCRASNAEQITSPARGFAINVEAHWGRAVPSARQKMLTIRCSVHIAESRWNRSWRVLPNPSVAPRFDLAKVRQARRHLTVLFCDLVGSAEIASRLDPEEWSDVVAYHSAAANALNPSVCSSGTTLSSSSARSAYSAYNFASSLSVFASCPWARAKSLTQRGFTTRTGNSASRNAADKWF